MRAPLERLAHGDWVPDHADRPRVEVAPELQQEQEPRVLDPDRLARDRAQDLVAPPIVARTGADVRGRVPPRAAAPLEDAVVEPVELADLAVAARVEAVSLRDGAELYTVIGQHAGDCRGAAAVHSENDDDPLVAQDRKR